MFFIEPPNEMLTASLFFGIESLENSHSSHPLKPSVARGQEPGLTQSPAPIVPVLSCPYPALWSHNALAWPEVVI